MRFLFTTLQFEESDGYLGISNELRKRGHEVIHIAVSRRAVDSFRAEGFEAQCLPELMARFGEDTDFEAESRRLEQTYGLRTLREIWIADPACRRLSEADCLARTVRNFLAIEAAFDRHLPNVVVPEVGSETMRSAAHAIGRGRNVPVLFLFLTIFPAPLRLYVDEPHQPIVAPDEVRQLSASERNEVDAFVNEFIERDRPILPHRVARLSAAKLRDFARHVTVLATTERDNDYLRPHRFVTNFVSQRSRGLLARRLYRRHGQRPFVYFPLHVTDDFKVKRVIPHCVDQAYLIEQLADALPHGYDLVLKEHPVSIGRNPLSFLRRITQRANVRLVDPTTSSHDLIRQAAAVIVISSTVGLEALLHNRPVMTMGQPFYSGYGVTVDVDSFREIRAAVSRVLTFEPDRERVREFLHAAMRSTYPGKPASVDRSAQNLATLAASLEHKAIAALAERAISLA